MSATTRPGVTRRALLIGAVAAGGGCDYVYYRTWEKLGREKRDILARRVANSREVQEKAKEQFQTTLERFQELTGFEGGDLEKAYEKLAKEYERSEERAQRVRNRIQDIEQVARDLFREWGREIGEISSRNLRAQSERLLRETEERYEELIAKMRAAEAKMEPVLAAFRDQTLFLKHNLNARAIQSLDATSLQIDREVAALVAEIEASIAEADEFVAELAAT